MPVSCRERHAPPHSLNELDAAGASFVTIFNCLHAVDVGFREVILRGLGPVELFNAVVAGENELYRLGTSGYRGSCMPSSCEALGRAVRSKPSWRVRYRASWATKQSAPRTIAAWSSSAS